MNLCEITQSVQEVGPLQGAVYKNIVKNPQLDRSDVNKFNPNDPVHRRANLLVGDRDRSGNPIYRVKKYHSHYTNPKGDVWVHTIDAGKSKDDGPTSKHKVSDIAVHKNIYK